MFYLLRNSATVACSSCIKQDMTYFRFEERHRTLILSSTFPCDRLLQQKAQPRWEDTLMLGILPAPMFSTYFVSSLGHLTNTIQNSFIQLFSGSQEEMEPRVRYIVNTSRGRRWAASRQNRMSLTLTGKFKKTP